MATEESGTPRVNLMEQFLKEFRERYVEEHGEEPSEELLEEARTKILLNLAKEDRDRNRELYDELAKE